MTNIERTIRAYLNASAGTGNVPSDHTILCFIGMIETGEATMDMFRDIGGRYLTDRITEQWDRIRADRV